MVKQEAKQTKIVKGHCEERPICCMKKVPLRPLADGLPDERLSLIRYHEKKWANGTVLHYYFYNNTNLWDGDGQQKDAVRQAFQIWKDLGIGLEFVEVDNASEAEVRIGFDFDDGSWSTVGRDTVDLAPDPNERTMNFGWDLTDEYGRDTALHEIGHLLGFPHEHQNPNAGISWNEDFAYDYYQRTQGWSKDSTFWNIIRKLDPSEVRGSSWDRNSIMHYWFPAGVIVQPEELAKGHTPTPNLTQIDIDEVRKFYPPMEVQENVELNAFESKRLQIEPGQQVNFRISPKISRTYKIQTFGNSDTVMALFEMEDGEALFYDADDDSGFDRNSKLKVRLNRGREYILRIRLYWADVSDETAVFMWS